LFFEHFIEHQQQTLERLCRFIGYAGQPRWDAGLGEQNVSSERMRQSAWRDAIARFPGMTTLRRSLMPQAWRERIKGAWMMKERPQLSQTNLRRLRDIYDEDLATLGAWLGVIGLRCDTFHHIAGAGHPTWQHHARAPAA
jgi:hypothetical protein